jgi:lipopolysaccharide assembly outer membrane protein LptD (OstA)
LNGKPLFLFFFLFLSGVLLYAQSPAPSAPESPPSGGLTAEFVLERDIATSSLAELADWCRSLGLSEAGGREELAARIRTHYKIGLPEETPGAADAGEKGPAGAEAGAGAAAEGTEAETAGAAKETEGTAEAETELSPDGMAEEEAVKKEPLLITIESAKTTEYFTVEAVNENYVRLRGSVSVALKDGEIIHRIKAGELLYNRTRNIMSASGGVEYMKEDGDTTETFRGGGITVDLDTWSTVFMEGVSDREITEGESRYRFAGEVISRSGEDSTVLRHARISNADNEEAYWSINASTLWLLPSSDWAVFNAVLKVGEIPVLYLPYFYYPADEIVFHPVIGYRSRESTFLQTTTYLLGRPKAESSSESSISTIMGSGAGMEKKLEGVFLRSTGKKARDENEVRLSLLADAYINLGLYLGTELAVPARAPFGEINLSAGIGFSRDIVPVGAGYTPFAPAYDGTSVWNSSRLFSLGVPFRYRLNTSGSVNGSQGPIGSASLLWDFPFYSDPVVDKDFLHRSEDSDLLTLIQSGTTPDLATYTDSLGSYVWSLNGNITLSLPSLSPYITSLSLSSATSSLSFSSRTNSDKTNPSHPSYAPYSPDASFFFPQKFTVYSLSASISGTPLTIGKTAQVPGDPVEDSLKGLGTPVSPWAAETGGETEKTDTQRDALSLNPPEISRTAETIIGAGNTLTLDYNLNPAAASEIDFNASRWNKPDDIDWGDRASQLFTFRADGNLGLTFSENRELYTTGIRFYGASSWQEYTYLNTNAALDTAAAKQQAHSMTYFNSSAEYTLAVKPFYKNSVWENTSFQYTLKGLLGKTNYDPLGDSWSFENGGWNRDDIEIHRLQANINASVLEKTQTLLLTADLPPEESALGADATARIWISETNARTRVRDPFTDPLCEPLYVTETLNFSDRISLQQYAIYDPEYSDFTILTTGLNLWEFTASFTATRGKSYRLENGNTPGIPSGWYENTGETLNPQELRLAYNKTFSTEESGPFVFSLSVNTGLSFDLRRYTYSKFTFNLGVTATINRFLDVSLSSISENAEIYRYIQDIPFFETGVEVPGEKNPLLDLIDSFRFDDTSRRTSSGFKLKSFDLKLIHHLGDWDATLGVTLTPELDRASFPPSYIFNPVISFVIQWKPISAIKTDMNYDKDGFRY